MDNFRQLYKTFYFLSIEGVVDEAEFYAAKGMDTSAYVAAMGENTMATIRYSYADMAAAMNQYYDVDDDGNPFKLYTENHEGEVVLRFYRYSERKALMTLEVVENYDSNGAPILNPNKAEGKFYVLTSAVEELLEDAESYLAGNKVVFDN